MRKRTARFLRASGVAVALAIAAVLLVLNCGECSGTGTGIEVSAGPVLASRLGLESDGEGPARSVVASADAASRPRGELHADANDGATALPGDTFGRRDRRSRADVAPDSKGAVSQSASGGVLPLLLDSSHSRRGRLSDLLVPGAPSAVAVGSPSGGAVPIWVGSGGGGGGTLPSGSLPVPGPSVPEPSAGLLFGAGLLTVATRLARRRRA